MNKIDLWGPEAGVSSQDIVCEIVLTDLNMHVCIEATVTDAPFCQCQISHLPSFIAVVLAFILLIYIPDLSTGLPRALLEENILLQSVNIL